MQMLIHANVLDIVHVHVGVKQRQWPSKNVHVTIISIFIDMFVLIFMSLNMDMTSGDVTARKTMMYNFLSQIAHNKYV